MKKTIIFIFLSITFLTSPINAEEKKKMTDEEFFRIMEDLDKKEKKLDEELIKEKEETKSAIELGKKLDKVLNILSK